jgi:hypothetical protein
MNNNHKRSEQENTEITNVEDKVTTPSTVQPQSSARSGSPSIQPQNTTQNNQINAFSQSSNIYYSGRFHNF